MEKSIILLKFVKHDSNLGYQFLTNSDTEVLLMAYLEYGEKLC